jgi:hypothetical protein
MGIFIISLNPQRSGYTFFLTPPPPPPLHMWQKTDYCIVDRCKDLEILRLAENRLVGQRITIRKNNFLHFICTINIYKHCTYISLR